MTNKAADKTNPMVMEVVTDPVDCAELARHHEQFERNWDWLEAHATNVYSHRGKYICIAGRELFVGDTVEEVLGAAKAAHPDDEGRFTRYIPLDRGPRIYAH
jgi:hypothetical protein